MRRLRLSYPAYHRLRYIFWMLFAIQLLLVTLMILIITLTDISQTSNLSLWTYRATYEALATLGS